MPSSRTSFETESNFSLIDHGGGHGSESFGSGNVGDFAGDSSSVKSYGDGRLNSYSFSQILSNPNSSAAVTISTNLSNLNPLRSTTGPKTGATRGKAATPIVLSDIPKVQRKEFDAYIDSVRAEYTKWSKLQGAIVDSPILDDLDVNKLPDEDQTRRKRVIAQALYGSTLGHSVSGWKELPILDEIPEIFFEENFSLANPRTFDLVTVNGWSSSDIKPQPSLADFATDQILQEKLSHYLDIVELHLNVEISMRSASFFSALSNLQALNSQSAEALKQIELLKSMMSEVDEGVAKKGLETVRKGAKRRRLCELDLAIENVKEVLRAVEQAEDLADAGEIEGALDIVEGIESAWEASLQEQQALPGSPTQETSQARLNLTAIGEEDESKDDADALRPPKSPPTGIFSHVQHNPPVRIAKISALSAVPAKLASLRVGVAQSLEHEFLAILVHELREELTQYVIATDQWKEAKQAELSRHDETKIGLGSNIADKLEGLIRCGKPAFEGAVSAWRQAMLKEVRRALREELPQVVSSAQEDDDGLTSSSPSSRSSFEVGRPSHDGSSTFIVRSLSHIAYMQMIRKLHARMLGCVSITDLQSRVISSAVSRYLQNGSGSRRVVLENANSISQAFDDAWTVALQSDLTETVQMAAELVNVRLAKLVTSRAEIHSLLTLKEFVAVFEETWQFVLDCEVICRKMIVGLRGVMVTQAKSFLQAFHQRHLTEAAKQVENEQWSPADVPASIQQIIDRIVDSAVSNPIELDFGKAGSSGSNEKSSGKAAKHANIEERSYFAVAASLSCLLALEEYLKVVINLPLLTIDVLSKIIEFLKQFNSRTCQVVLGAGAMRSAGLKNITAKHLALASQSLSIMISLIPYVRECLRRHLKAKQAIILADFDKLKRDYQEHQYEIHAKLVAIMGDRLAVHCQTLQAIDWEKQTSRTPNPYMETLVKETGTLHKVLIKYLPGSALEMVMMQVLSAINSRLADEYGRLVIVSDDARQRILADANYMKNKFAELKGLERPTPGAELEDLVRMKRLESPATPNPPAKPFMTPSLTRPRKSISLHTRTTSLSAVPVSEVNAPKDVKVINATDKEDEDVVQSAEVDIDDAVPDTEVIQRSVTEPENVLMATHTDGPEENETMLSGKPELERIESEEPVAPEMIPLPLSPLLEGEATFPEQMSPSSTTQLPSSPTPTRAIEQQNTSIEPMTPSKHLESATIAPATTSNGMPAHDLANSSNQSKSPALERLASLPSSLTQPEAPALERRATTASPPSAGNVKNRLASLFAKRPSTASLPKINIPSLSALLTAEPSPIKLPSSSTEARVKATPALESPNQHLPQDGNVSPGTVAVPAIDVASFDQEASKVRILQEGESTSPVQAAKNENKAVDTLPELREAHMAIESSSMNKADTTQEAEVQEAAHAEAGMNEQLPGPDSKVTNDNHSGDKSADLPIPSMADEEVENVD